MGDFLRYGRLKAMYQRDHERSGHPGTRPHSVPHRRSGNPVLALQRAIGNRGTTRFLARKSKNAGTFERSVTIAGLGEIEVKGGNVDVWLAKKLPETLELTTTKGKHSDALKAKADSKEKIDVLTVSVVMGQNTWMVITFKHGRIKGYTDDGKTESWKLVNFDDVHYEQTSIGKARPG